MIAWLKQTANWISRILVWLWEAYRLWIAIFAAPCVFLICWTARPDWESRIRFTGMFLQLMGLITVAIGIREIRSLFGRPSLLCVGRNWLTRFPKFRIDVRIHVASGALMAGGGAVSAFGTSGPSPTATLEERVANLEKNVNQAHALIHEVQRKVDREAELRQNELNAEKREREDGDSKNKQLVEEAAAGGHYLETTGAFWLTIGITLATASNEFAKLFSDN